MDRENNHESSSKKIRSIKITVVGDGNVGKTSLLISYVKNEFPEDYRPTVFETFAHMVSVDGVDIPVSLWDTAGQEAYDQLRPLSYKNTDCFIICYAMNIKASYQNVRTKWVPEVKHHCPKAKLILVGTKADLCQDCEDCVSRRAGKHLRRRIKAVGFVECSAKTRENVELIFAKAVRSVISTRKTPSLLSCLL